MIAGLLKMMKERIHTEWIARLRVSGAGIDGSADTNKGLMKVEFLTAKATSRRHDPPR